MKICRFRGGGRENSCPTTTCLIVTMMLYFAVAVRSFSLTKTTALPRRSSMAAAVVTKQARTQGFGFGFKRYPSASTVRFLSGNSSSNNNGEDSQGETKEDSSSNPGVVDKLDEYRNKNNINDQVFSAISHDGGVKVTVCTARNLINEVMLAHNLTPVSADALGRTMVCALLMSNGIQAEQTVQLTMNCKWFF